MGQYRNQVMKQFADQQVRFAPRDRRLDQIERTEHLLGEIDPREKYAYADLCRRITGFRPEIDANVVVSGDEAAHDLRLLVEDLSDSIDLPAEAVGEPVFTLEDVSRRFNVSTKTVDRWRNRGLVSRRLVFGNRKRIAVLESALNRFVRTHPDDVKRGSEFSQLREEERNMIIEQARRLARAGGRLSDVSRRLSQHLKRSPETIRYTIKNFDREHPNAAVFPNAPKPLTEELRLQILAEARQGTPVEELARRYQRTTTRIYRIINETRAQKLREEPIEYIPSPEFEDPEREEVILGPGPAVERKQTKVRTPPGLPPYLASLYDVPLLTKEEEVYYFRKMNYLKFLASRMRNELDVARAKSKVLDQIEGWIEEAVAIRNTLIRSNLRLVVSIAKKHVKPNVDFFAMVSDGNLSLMRAIEKFDYTKGNKFSTYATWAIMKNYARSIPAEHQRQDRFRTGNDEFFQGSKDVRTDQYELESVNMRQHQLLMEILGKLEDREKDIIKARFGLEQGTEPMTLEQVGQRFGVTKERIRQLETRALNKLRKIACQDKLDVPGLD